MPDKQRSMWADWVGPQDSGRRVVLVAHRNVAEKEYAKPVMGGFNEGHEECGVNTVHAVQNSMGTDINEA